MSVGVALFFLIQAFKGRGAVPDVFLEKTAQDVDGKELAPITAPVPPLQKPAADVIAAVTQNVCRWRTLRVSLGDGQYFAENQPFSSEKGELVQVA